MTNNKPADLQQILNSLNGQRPASEVVKELNNTIGFLNNLKAAIEGQGKEQSPAANTSHYYNAAPQGHQWEPEPMPE